MEELQRSDVSVLTDMLQSHVEDKIRRGGAGDLTRHDKLLVSTERARAPSATLSLLVARCYSPRALPSPADATSAAARVFFAQHLCLQVLQRFLAMNKRSPRIRAAIEGALNLNASLPAAVAGGSAAPETFLRRAATSF